MTTSSVGVFRPEYRGFRKVAESVLGKWVVRVFVESGAVSESHGVPDAENKAKKACGAK